ncbi:MAG: hypothetical protein JNN25_18835 [Candidatus Kapabacteria bacterium]|nr:hypothetical protein [Candidatus Kapabacteria bacterium]
MTEEQGQRILTLLERILSGQEQANAMLHEINTRLEHVERRFERMIKRRAAASPQTTVHTVKGITGTWQSLN